MINIQTESVTPYVQYLNQKCHTFCSLSVPFQFSTVLLLNIQTKKTTPFAQYLDYLKLNIQTKSTTPFAQYLDQKVQTLCSISLSFKFSREFLLNIWTKSSPPYAQYLDQKVHTLSSIFRPKGPHLKLQKFVL